MADETQDIRIRLTAEDRASDPTRRLLREISALEKKLKSGFGKSRITNSIVDEASIKLMSKAGKAVDGLTQKTMLWARGQREMGKVTYDSYDRMERAIQKSLATFVRSDNKKKQVMRKGLVEQVKQAQAVRHLLNQDHRERVKMEEKLSEKLARIEDAKYRRMEQSQATHHRNLARQRRHSFAGLRSAPGRMMNRIDGNGFFNSPAFYAMAAGAGTVAAARSSIRSATDLDKAETFARMYMDQSKVNARGLRNDFAIPRSIELGQDPARLFMTAVDAAKAGVPDAAAAGTAEMVTVIAKTFGVEIEQAMDGMGFAIAQEIGAGRLKGDDLSGIRRIGNITSFLAGKTAARPDQMLSFLRTGLGSGAMLGMDAQSSLAFGAAAVQGGAQGQQAARMLGSMAADLNNIVGRAKDTRRQRHRSEDDKMFLRLPSLLGYGSFEDLHGSFKKSPTAIFELLKRFGKIKDFDVRNRAMTAMFGQEFSRFTANLINSPGVMDQSVALAKQAGEQTASNDWMSTSWAEFTKSLEYFLGKVGATWAVIKSELGDTMKPFIEQFSQWVGDWYKAVKSGGLKERFRAILNGLTEGFLGKPGTFRDLLDQVFGKPGEGDAGSPEKYLKFAKGFAEGLKSVASTIGGVIKGLAKAFGVDTADPEAMGKFVAQFMGFVVALHFVRPVISVLGLLGDAILIFAGVLKIAASLGLFGFLSKIPGAKGLGAKILGGTLLGGAGAVGGMALMGDGRADAAPSDFKGLVEAYKKEKEEAESKKAKKDGSVNIPEELKHKSSYRSSVDDLAKQLEKFGGKVERASFMSSAFSAFSPGGSAGIPGQASISSPSIGGVPEIFTSKPGQALPYMGGSSGPIISRGSSSGGMNKEAFDKIFAGTPLSGKYDSIVNAAKANKIDPALLAGVIAHESGGGKFLSGNNPGGIMDPATNWAKKMQFGSLDDGINKTASTVAKNLNRAHGSMSALANIYAPRGAANDPRGLNGYWLGGVTKFRNQLSNGSDSVSVATGDPVATGEKLLGLNEYRDTQKIAEFIGRDPRGRVNAWCARFVNTALAKNGIKGTGSDMAGSFKNWGAAVLDGVQRGDIMVRNGHVGFATGQTKNGMIEMLSGNSSDSVRKTWEPAGKYQLRRGYQPPTSDVPSPTQNVPPSAATQQPFRDSRNLSGGSGNQVAIHINGNSHDPEALATLVQRRIDEQMNWRIHDVDHASA